MRDDVHTRQDAIVAAARVEGRVVTEALADRLGVSPQTIRKDLNELCGRGALARVHGGAVLAGGTENLRYERRRAMHGVEKDAIGRAVAALIPPRASLFMTIGTTTEAAARALSAHEGLMVVTNNLNVANLLRVQPEIEVVLAGGTVRAADGGIVGEAAVDFINGFKVDHAVIGVSAIDADGGLLDYDLREVKLAHAVMANARSVILAADSSKFERAAPVRIGDLSRVSTLVTDKAPPHIRAICEAADVALVETS